MASKKTNKAKGFKRETIKKIVKALVALVALYRAILEKGGFVGLVISNGNSKIGRCMNVSLAPIVTCGNCKECKCFCYDVKACLQYENVRKARAKNTALFQYSREEFFNQLWAKMARKKTNKFLRFHVSGEIVDINHFEYMIKTAEMFPDFKIWTYTKMYWIVNQYIREHGGNKNCIPSNFSVMFSEWKGLPIDNPYNMPVFRCIYPEEQAPSNCMECPGNCDICKNSGIGCIASQSVFAHLH
jgi:hypothetical protein